MQYASISQIIQYYYIVYKLNITASRLLLNKILIVCYYVEFDFILVEVSLARAYLLVFWSAVSSKNCIIFQGYLLFSQASKHVLVQYKYYSLNYNIYIDEMTITFKMRNSMLLNWDTCIPVIYSII